METKPLEWTPALAINVDIIDKQHQDLLNAISELTRAMSQGKGKSEIAKVVNFLTQYVDDHFGTEERLMQSKAYPGFVAHLAMHKGFRDDFEAIKQKLNDSGPSGFLAIEVQMKLGDWLWNHIAQQDKAFGKYLATL